MATQTLKYQTTPITKISAKTAKNSLLSDIDSVSTGMVLLYLAKRHKFGLVSTWAVIMTISYLFPPFWDVIGSLI